MSATNWAYCYKCESIDKKRLSELSELSMQPGSDEWEEYHLIEKKLEDWSSYQTLREDYEIGMDGNNTFVVSYGCSCEKCGLEHTFNHEEVAE